MTRFRCKRCNYQLNRSDAAAPRACPNCGETGVMAREQTADELLSDD